MTTQPPSTQEMADSPAVDAEEERPTRPIPAVQMTTQPSSGQEVADPTAADSSAAGSENDDEERVDPEEVDGEKGDAVAAGSEEFEGEKVDAVAADTEEVDAVAADTEEVDAVAADSEKAGGMSSGPDDSDTVQMPPVGAVHNGGRHPLPQLPEQQVRGPVPVQKPADKRRFEFLALAAGTLAALLIGALVFANRDLGGVTAQPDATVAATATMPVSKPPSERSSESTDTGRGESTIQLDDLSDSARPLEAVRIQGTYSGGADAFLRVQRRESGKWLDFPVPTKVDKSGRFTIYVELGQPGRYLLRVLEPDSGVTSRTFVLVIRG
jgi:hypothetical protein